MTYVTGECCATALIQAGLSRREVVVALEREIGLTEQQASAAWLHVTLHQGEIGAIRRVVRDLEVSAPIDLRDRGSVFRSTETG
jgi:hypothetical protein